MSHSAFHRLAKRRRSLVRLLKLNGITLLLLTVVNVLTAPFVVILGLVVSVLLWFNFNSPWFAALNFLNTSYVAFVLFRVARAFLRLAKPLDNREGLRLAPQSIHQEIWDAIRNATALLNVDPGRVRVFLPVSPQYSRLAAFQDSRGFAIVIPPEAIVQLRRRPAEVIAALSHEVAHFDQGDCRYWPYAWCLFDMAVKAYLPMYVLLLPLLLAIHFYVQPVPAELSQNLFTQYAVAPVALAATFLLMRRMRRLSEKAADLATVLSGSGLAAR